MDKASCDMADLLNGDILMPGRRRLRHQAGALVPLADAFERGFTSAHTALACGQRV
jgi:hypothetical protein